LLLVDASQGIQAQTVANFYLAFGQGLHVIPVINKASDCIYGRRCYGEEMIAC